MFIPKTYSVESVTAGHPDKVCDQISDAILDECLRQDSLSRVAVECFGAHGKLVIGGEVTTKAKMDYAAIAKQVYRDIGYNDNLDITINIVQQSPNIAAGVDHGGAGDQGIMYGYATNETPEMMPKGIVLVHRLTKGLEALRRNEPTFSFLGPDGKAQVTVSNGKVTAVVVSAQHSNDMNIGDVRRLITEQLVQPIIGDLSGIKVYINPAGPWNIGGFAADTGLTGRKIMVDTYGGLIPHGGGAFSGKDATKVDRSAAYMARYVARSLVAKRLAKECLVSLAYAIGDPNPVMVEAVDERGESLRHYLSEQFDFRPRAILERLGLRQPVFRETAAYGHFGRKKFSWEG